MNLAWSSLLLLSCASCSFVYHDALEQTQCDVDLDCAGSGLVCVDHVCESAPAVQARTCTQDNECVDGQRCGYDGFCYAKWSCIDAPADWPTPITPFHVRTLLRKIDTGATDLASVGEVNVTACVAEDPLCTNPLVGGDQVTLDANKLLDIPFTSVNPSGFVGLIRIQPRVAGAYNPTFLQVTPTSPWVADLTTQNETLLSSDQTTALLQQFVGVDVNPASAIVGFFIYDCGGRPAAGVSVTPTTTTTGATFFPLAAGKVPLVGQKATTEEGVGFLLGLAANRLEVFVLRDEATQRVLAQSVSFIVQGGGLNLVDHYPRYSAVKSWMSEYKRRTGR